MLKERDEREVPLGSKRQVHWLADAEGFLADVHWSRGQSQSSLNMEFRELGLSSEVRLFRGRMRGGLHFPAPGSDSDCEPFSHVTGR